jgi:S1-C subfamily serine protease
MSDLVRMFAAIKPAVVAISGQVGDGPSDLEVIGSGFNVDPKGLVLTCRHVVEPVPGAKPGKLQVQFIFTAGGRVGRLDVPVGWAMVPGSDDDIAAIRLMPISRDLPALQIGDGSRVFEGTRVGLCGFPLGLALESNARSSSSTFQIGIVGSIVPYPTAPPARRRMYRLDIPVNVGNSGGPVFLQEDGTVVGVLAERPSAETPVYEKRIRETEYTAAGTSALAHAVPIDRSRGLVERMGRLTNEEINKLRRGVPPDWWKGQVLPLADRQRNNSEE